MVRISCRPWPSVVGDPADRCPPPVEGVELVEQAGLVAAHRQNEVGASLVQIPGMFTLGMHHVGADHGVGQVGDLVQERHEAVISFDLDETSSWARVIASSASITPILCWART